MVFNSWVNLKEKCPIDLERLHRYAKDFESRVGININYIGVNKSKTILLESRGDLNNMFNMLIQLLYKKDILTESEDKMLFKWLSEDFARYLKNLDDREKELLTDFDNPKEVNNIGISRLASYQKELRTSSDSIIYESLFKASEDYNDLEDDKKELRKFFYMLFCIIQVKLSIFGGMEREKGKRIQRNLVSSAGWENLMGEKGQKFIEDADEDAMKVLTGLEGLGNEEGEEGEGGEDKNV